MNPRTHTRRSRILALILLCPALVSIPFFSSEWKEAVFFSPIRILSLSPKLKKESFTKSLLNRFQDPYYDLGLRFEYLSRRFKDPSSEKNIGSLGKLLLSSLGLKLVRIYDQEFNSIYSSDKGAPVFHADLELFGLAVKKMQWVADSKGFLLYRNAKGNLYFQIRQEEGDQIVAETNGTRSAYLPRESDEGVLYWVFRKNEDGYELLETNLDPNSPILPGSPTSGVAHFSETDEADVMVHTLLQKSSQTQNIFKRPVWEKIRKGDIEIFLTVPRNSRPTELLIILGGLAVSFFTLIAGVLATRLFYSIRMESRFLEREDTLRIKADILGLLNRFREQLK